MNVTLVTTLHPLFTVTIRRLDYIAPAISLINEHVTYGDLGLFDVY